MDKAGTRMSAEAGSSLVQSDRKALGQFFTPPEVARTLVQWALENRRSRLLDPSCGDGQFLAFHRKSVGIELDRDKARAAKCRAPWSLVHEGDFFEWARETKETFDAVAGNPPFIRFQRFSGEMRDKALSLCSMIGADLSGLTSSWAPFVVVAASLLKPGGRLAFVVPAEIGHAAYARNLIEWLCGHFGHVRLIAYREKLFPDLSEDAWVLFCRDFSESCTAVHFNRFERFSGNPNLPTFARRIELTAWRVSGAKLRRNLLSDTQLALYEDLCSRPSVTRFSEIAHAGIGYVTGANDFFHLRPSVAKSMGIPKKFLRVSVRSSERLPPKAVDRAVVRSWIAKDEAVLLLDLGEAESLPHSVRRYLSSGEATEARKAYKCRTRDPWYAVPDIRIPDAFLSYMSTLQPALVRNEANCTCTHSVHAVRFRSGIRVARVQAAWNDPLCQLSCELEGHPLGGGVLKLEPGEAANIRLALDGLNLAERDQVALKEAINEMRRWRHCA